MTSTAVIRGYPVTAASVAQAGGGGGGNGNVKIGFGPSASRPAAPNVTQLYFDTDLGFLIICTAIQPNVWANVGSGVLVDDVSSTGNANQGNAKIGYGSSDGRPASPTVSQMYFDTDLGFLLICTAVNPTTWVNVGSGVVVEGSSGGGGGGNAKITGGPTADRPVNPTQYTLYFDTDLGYLITVASTDPLLWVNVGTGAPVDDEGGGGGDIQLSGGPTSKRPTAPGLFQQYYDTDLDCLLVCIGLSPVIWSAATGIFLSDYFIDLGFLSDAVGLAVDLGKITDAPAKQYEMGTLPQPQLFILG